ncbi:MAG: hypothetical protein Ct9H300mP4_03450 [Gammaproteobacteria bacterium]|nr:MAG: hypothetical protein Ct9H300mP4_03450 [Gammaproteobacteria bacterium]
MKLGFAGRDFLKKSAFSGHFTSEGINNKEAKIKLAEARSIARKYGKEVANSIPIFLHANPFMPLTLFWVRMESFGNLPTVSCLFLKS